MSYLLSHPGDLLALLGQHLGMTGLALAIAIFLAVPLALLVARLPWLNIPILGSLGVLYTIPSLALMIFLVPIFGLNATSVIVAMVLYAQVILVRHLSVGLAGLDPDVMAAARAMGMNLWQRWWWVQVPLVLPVFLAGVRLATIVAIAIATIGAKFNAGGLGKLLFDGLQTNRYDKIVAGAIAVAALALAMNGLLLWLEQLCPGPGRRKSAPGPPEPLG
ncbi:MAG TPA: ABC transporter permease [Leptolyngbyaceae cyanobacterium M65_K2018_010]|nr:ABC transporter permease [Leptolyngbyaceae cyanobacterium M65_K2018_010]